MCTTEKPPINFAPSETKIIEAILWLADREPSIDVYHVAKVLYFADKEHLNRYGRPVLGDWYCKLAFGPVPSLAYDLIKREGLRFFAETLKLFDDAVEVRQQQREDQKSVPAIFPKRSVNLRRFSRSDIECLENAHRKYGSMSFAELFTLSHKERAWVEAQEKGRMDFELMIDEDTPNRDELVEYVRETCRTLVF